MIQTDEALLLAAKTGDEDAFEVIVQRYAGLIWRGYRYQNVRTGPQDWQHEARIVLFYCIQRIKTLKWGILTVYFQRALKHHPITLWRQEDKRANYVKEALEFASVGTLDRFLPEPELQLHVFCAQIQERLTETQYKLLQLRILGYSISECADELNKSKSWCYLTMKEIRNYCEQWTR